MTREELIEKLLDVKARLERSYPAETVSKVIPYIADYSDNNDWIFDEYLYTFETDDMVIQFCEDTVRKYWIKALRDRLSDFEYDDDRYIVDDTDWTIYNLHYSDVESWIDDILETLDYNENE